MSRRFVWVIILLILLSGINAVAAQDSGLQIGDSAQVHVFDEGLKLRAGPGANNTVVENMPSGTIVQIIGGPTRAGGLVWWYVRTPSGSIGWCVEAANGVQTLVAVAGAAEPEGVYDSIELAVPSEAIYQVALGPDADRFAIVAAEGIVVADLKGGGHVAGLLTLFPGARLRWSSDGQYVQRYYDSPNGGAVIFNAQSGEDVTSEITGEIDWLDPGDVISLRVGAILGSNQAELVIQHESGTLRGGNPATFITGGVAKTLGDGSGGIAWQDGSDWALIWSKADAGNPTLGTAEVWDLRSGVRLAIVPHNSPDLSVAGQVSNPPTLNSETGLLAAVTIDNSDPTHIVFNLAIYRLIAGSR